MRHENYTAPSARSSPACDHARPCAQGIDNRVTSLASASDGTKLSADPRSWKGAEQVQRGAQRMPLLAWRGGICTVRPTVRCRASQGNGLRRHSTGRLRSTFTFGGDQKVTSAWGRLADPGHWVRHRDQRELRRLGRSRREHVVRLPGKVEHQWRGARQLDLHPRPESYVNPTYAGTSSINAVQAYVSLLNANGLVVILDLPSEPPTRRSCGPCRSSATADEGRSGPRRRRRQVFARVKRHVRSPAGKGGRTVRLWRQRPGWEGAFRKPIGR